MTRAFWGPQCRRLRKVWWIQPLSISRIASQVIPNHRSSREVFEYHIHHKLAPPLSTASISLASHVVLLNLAGNSSLSKYSPSFGFTLPKLLPLLLLSRPPCLVCIVKDEDDDDGGVVVEEVVDCEEEDEEDWLPLPAMGPCCCAERR